MTTLAIVGAGLAGRSLIYTLAKEEKQFEKITIFSSDDFAFPCSVHSTAIVAPRGLSIGHSALGDELLEAFKNFSEHVRLDSPAGVEKITQITYVDDKNKDRYSKAKSKKLFLREETEIAEDPAYLITPEVYLDWLLKESQAMQSFPIEVITDFVTESYVEERVHLKTLNGRSLSFDKVIFAGGSYNRYWKPLSPESKLSSSKAVQGCYLEFNDVPWNFDSFSLTYKDDNLIWNAPLKRLLVGSTTHETAHHLIPQTELRTIHEKFVNLVDLSMPEFSRGEAKVGLREKAQKRSPYLVQEGSIYFVGGFYKNGFSLALKKASDLSRLYL